MNLCVLGARFIGSKGQHHPADKRRPRRVCLDDLYCLDTVTLVWRRVQSGLAPLLPRKGHRTVVLPRSL